MDYGRSTNSTKVQKKQNCVITVINFRLFEKSTQGQTISVEKFNQATDSAGGFWRDFGQNFRGSFNPTASRYRARITNSAPLLARVKSGVLQNLRKKCSVNPTVWSG
ncbi:hypothetical protein RvY_14450 [Ramazzottius varieornatus]|uniref:Uncharacterized protein n=1 Tax=Ramazzottius varieornatus TaxID=947166 RepID=A0A1D1VRC6_RAMVA|nr:hypothetical protein RvY_14450 [Ramazzottius varieornatus]